LPLPVTAADGTPPDWAKAKLLARKKVESKILANFIRI
jgi:hypothetical protein